MDVPTSRRIVLLGKTGAGKSSLANTILGEDVFKISHAPVSETSHARAETKHVNGKSLTLIDTLSIFDTCASESLRKAEIVRCITECAPGPHVFLIVLKVEKFTEQEQDVIKQICKHFSEDALKYAAVVFTHGDQLCEGTKIEEFVGQNEGLGDLVKKCGGRCHVVDNKYWQDNGEDNYRNNGFQVAQILDTIDKIFDANKGSCYTNEMLQAVKRELQTEEERIRQSTGKRLSHEEIRSRAVTSVYDRLLIELAGLATGILLGALLGVVEMAAATMSPMFKAALSGALRGGLMGHNAAAGAETPRDAVQRVAGAVWNAAKLSSGVGAKPISDQNYK